jgi:hypothetical protein
MALLATFLGFKKTLDRLADGTIMTIQGALGDAPKPPE